METATVCVLGYEEEGQCIAHALEMDIIGVGDTWDAALQELKGNIEAHLAFAKDLGDDSLIFRPAPPHLFQKFKEAQEAQLRSLVRQQGERPLPKFRSRALDVQRNLDAAEFAPA